MMNINSCGIPRLERTLKLDKDLTKNPWEEKDHRIISTIEISLSMIFHSSKDLRSKTRKNHKNVTSLIK